MEKNFEERIKSLEQRLAKVETAVEQILEHLNLDSSLKKVGRPDQGHRQQRIDVAYDLIQTVNQQLTPGDRWEINQTLLNQRLGCDRVLTQEFLAQKKEEIQNLHQRWEIVPGKQNKGKNFQSLKNLLDERLKQLR